MSAKIGLTAAAFVGLGAVLSAGCSGDKAGGPKAAAILDDFSPAAITTSAEVIGFATMGSSPNVLLLGLAPYLAASFDPDAPCPVVTEESDTRTVITGGCTDEEGVTYDGRIVAEGSFGGKITYEGFSTAWVTTCGGVDLHPQSVFEGVMSINAGGGFGLDLRVDATEVDEVDCTMIPDIFAFDYSGRQELIPPDHDGDGEPDAEQYNGSGRVGSQNHGVAEVRTTNEVIDSEVCGSEASSGTTTIIADGNTVEVTYDGATDCDPESTVQWSLNGDAQGELAGIACSATASAGSPIGWLAGMVALAGLALARRRTRTRTRTRLSGT